MTCGRQVQEHREDVRVTQVRSYLLGKGWKLRPGRRKDAILLEGPVDDEGEPLVWQFPSDEHFIDYGRCVESLVKALEVIEQRPAEQILNDMLAEAVRESASAALT
jgi:hypothetical protein